MAVRVYYFYDQETANWGFSVPSLRVTGDAATRQEAEEQARVAILSVLAADGPRDGLSGAETGYFHVLVEKAVMFQSA